jgi:tripartite-type tricarboxylate transporter receptor subunit TctC
MRRCQITVFVTSGLAFVLAFASLGRGQDVEAFYRKNRTIEIVVGAGPGTPYALWAQTVGRHMQNHLPGSPTFIVKMMPGGGGITVANYLYAVAPKDGTSLATISRNLPLQAFLGAQKGIKFDPRKFQWLGSVEATVRTCAVLTNTGVRTVADLLQREVVVGGTGAGSGQSFLPMVVNNLVGTKFKLVEGYRSVDEIHLAIDRNEVSGICGLHDTTARHFADKIKSGEMTILFNLERQRAKELPETPSIAEFITDPEKKQLFAFITSPTEMGRPFVAPPGVPSERMAALRAAFDDTMQDRDFLDEVAKLKFELQVTRGEHLAALVEELYATPRDVVEKALKLMPETALQ